MFFFFFPVHNAPEVGFSLSGERLLLSGVSTLSTCGSFSSGLLSHDPLEEGLEQRRVERYVRLQREADAKANSQGGRHQRPQQRERDREGEREEEKEKGRGGEEE